MSNKISSEELQSWFDRMTSIVNAILGMEQALGRDYMHLFVSACAESDRGAVLMIHSAIDDALQELVLGFLKRQSPEAESDQIWLVSFEKGPTPPLGGFGVKTRFCYAAGLIDRDLKANLGKLGKIRNPFAHAWSQKVTLQPEHMNTLLEMVDDVEFRKEIEQLETKDDKHINRLKFVYVGYYLLEKLLVRIHQVTGNRAVRLPKPVTVQVNIQPNEPQSEDDSSQS